MGTSGDGLAAGIGVPGELEGVIERFDHVSMAVRSFADTDALIRLMGGVPVDGGYEAATDFHWNQYDLPGGGRLEVICTDSTDEAHFINRFLDQRGPGLHHLTFKVSDLGAAAEHASSLGFDVVGFDDSNPAWKELFIHPASSQGVLIQLAEFPGTP